MPTFCLRGLDVHTCRIPLNAPERAKGGRIAGEEGELCKEIVLAHIVLCSGEALVRILFP